MPRNSATTPDTAQSAVGQYLKQHGASVSVPTIYWWPGVGNRAGEHVVIDGSRGFARKDIVWCRIVEKVSPFVLGHSLMLDRDKLAQVHAGTGDLL